MSPSRTSLAAARPAASFSWSFSWSCSSSFSLPMDLPIELCEPALFHSLLNQRTDSRDVFQKIDGKAVPLLKVFRRIVGEPHFALLVVPCERFQWKIDRQPGRGDHQRRPAFRTAEDQQLRRAHGEAGLLRLTAVVDECKHRQAFLFEDRLEPFQ